MVKTKGRLLELAARIDQLPENQLDQLAVAARRAHESLQPPRPTPETVRGVLLELAGRFDAQLPAGARHRLGMAVGRAHRALPPRRPMPPNAGGVIVVRGS